MITLGFPGVHGLLVQFWHCVASVVRLGWWVLLELQVVDMEFECYMVFLSHLKLGNVYAAFGGRRISRWACDCGDPTTSVIYAYALVARA